MFLESNGCLTSEGFCHHSCVRTAAGFSCACKTGFMLDSNSVTCTGNLHRNYIWLVCCKKQEPRKLFRSGGGVKFFIYVACNYVICAECKYIRITKLSPIPTKMLGG